MSVESADSPPAPPKPAPKSRSWTTVTVHHYPGGAVVAASGKFRAIGGDEREALRRLGAMIRVGRSGK
jgi:hypothetical protein